MSLSRLIVMLLAGAFSGVFASSVSLAGRVLGSDGNGLGGVVVSLAGSGLLTTTDIAGAWSLAGETGIASRHGVNRPLAENLSIDNGHLRLHFQGHDVAGRPLVGRSSDAKTPKLSGAGRAQSVPDTLVYAFSGQVFLRDTVTGSWTGIVSRYAPGWNATVIYGNLVDERDGQTYRTLKVGSRIWMAQNLNYKVDSSWWYQGYDWSTETNHDEAVDNGAHWGRLYAWTAMMGLPDSCATRWCVTPEDCKYMTCGSSLFAEHQGVCPVGWHVPSEKDWLMFFEAVEALPGVAAQYDGTAVKSVTGWSTEDYVTPGWDRMGFRVLPAGQRYYSKGGFYEAGTEAYLWSDWEEDSLRAWSRSVSSSRNFSIHQVMRKTSALSVRCVMDSI